MDRMERGFFLSYLNEEIMLEQEYMNETKRNSGR